MSRKIASIKDVPDNIVRRRRLSRRRYASNKEKQSFAMLKYRYGITTQEYADLLVKQHGGCAICGDNNAKGDKLVVDHDHETGIVRGLLCIKCNVFVGKLSKNIHLLDKMLDYANLR